MPEKKYIFYVDKILPAIMPAGLEKVVPGYYAEVQDIDKGKVLSESQIKAVLLYSVYYCVLNQSLVAGYEQQKIINTLDDSIDDVDCLEDAEKELARKLITTFMNFKIIREDHALDDWLCEAIWPIFTSDEYVYPSALAGIISYGLNYKNILEMSDIRLTD